MTDTTAGLDPRTLETVRRAGLVVARRFGAEDAEGAAQEVVLRYVLEVRDGRGPLDAAQWARRVARNLCTDEHRRRRAAVTALEDAEDVDAVRWGCGPSAPTIARAQVKSALLPLAERDRELLLADAQGEPHVEIAARLGFASTDAATKRLHEVRRMLKRRHGWDLEPQRPY